MLDANTQDGLWCSINDEGMGLTGERVADKYGITRDEQDAYATASHQRAIAAQGAGRFADEIVPVTVKGRKGDTVVDADEGPRADTSPETLGRLKPAFRKDGSVTAGNAPGLNDGAASLLVMSEEAAAAHGLKPLAEITGYATGGLAPEWVMMTPVPATQKLLKNLGMERGRRRPLGAERGVQRAEPRREPRTGPRPRTRERERRRGGAGPPHRRFGRTHSGDAAARPEGSRTRKRAWQRCAWAAATGWRWPFGGVGAGLRWCGGRLLS